MIDKNLIVHFGVTGQHWGKRKEKMIYVYQCEYGFDRYYEDLISAKPTYQFESDMEADIYLTMHGYNRCETVFLTKKDGGIKPSKKYYNTNFYCSYVMLVIYVNNNEGEKMNKVEIHKDICKELTDLYEKKNSDYGNSFADLRKEYPNSVCLRLTDKLNRLKSLYDNNETHKIAESVEDTLKDIANYAIMELIERGYQPEKEPEYKNRLRIEYNGDEGDLYFEFWDKNGKKTEDEWFSICDDHPWNEKVFELAKDINKFLENMYWDEDEDECYIDPGPLSHEALQIARDLLYYEHSLFYDFSEFENRGAADLLNP